MRLRLFVSVSLVALIATSSLGEAALPKTKTRLMAPGDSIGGVALGGTFASAKKAWGKGGKCVNEFGSVTCTYETKKSTDWFGRYSGSPGKKVTEITIGAGSDATQKPVFNVPLAKLKTKKGIHIGSTGAAVMKAYPKAKFRQVPQSQGFEYYLPGPGKASTEFELSGDKTSQVQFIAMATPR